MIYKYPVRTAQWTHSASVIKTDQLILCTEKIAVCSEVHTIHTNTLCGQNVQCLNVTRDGKQSNQPLVLKGLNNQSQRILCLLKQSTDQVRTCFNAS